MERGTYHLTPASFTLATVNKTVLKHKQPAHTQKLCVIKQLHNTQRVSMTTRKLLGSSRRSCHCTHACPSRVHCSSNEASSHLEQSTTPVEVHCSAKNSTPLSDGRRTRRELVGFKTTQINQLNPQARPTGNWSDSRQLKSTNSTRRPHN